MSAPDAIAPPGGSRVDVWHLRIAEDEDVPHAGAGVLSADERARAGAYRRDADRRRFMSSRILLRAALSQYSDAPPDAWRVAPDGGGRPGVVSPTDLRRIRFSSSRAPGAALCAVAGFREFAVDVVSLDGWDFRPLARFACSDRELDHVLATRPEDQRRVFATYWALKEAYLKAIGVGLWVPPSSCSFRLDPDRPPAAEYLGAGGRPREWRFVLLHLGGRHVAALAARRRHGGDVATFLRPSPGLRHSGLLHPPAGGPMPAASCVPRNPR